MATTRLFAMHVHKNKSIRQCLDDTTHYIMNPSKTKDGALVKTFGCNPHTVDAEWAFSLRQYHDQTQRGGSKEVIAYQVRQSFKPGEVTPEQANAIGMEFAQRFLKGKHSFIVATHVDRNHIHNHILWNAVAMDGKRKWKNFFLSARAVARLSDQLCMEHQLSVITEPANRGNDYGTWLKDDKKLSHRDLLRIAIDETLQKKPSDFDEFLHMLEAGGWEVKRGKRMSLRYKDHTRFARLDSLGTGYDEASIRAVISGKQRNTPNKTQRVGLLIDIQAAIDAGKGVGYQYWAERENLKRAARSLLLLQEKGVDSYSLADSKISALIDKSKDLKAQCDALEKEIVEIQTLMNHITAYRATRAVAQAYRESGYSKQFAAEHADELRRYSEAKKAFQQYEPGSLPKYNDLMQRRRELIAQKQAIYSDYRVVKKEVKEMLSAKATMDQFFEAEEDSKQEYQRKVRSSTTRT